MIQQYISKCPHCGRDAIVEHSCYNPSGHFIREAKDRKWWVVKCENCVIITEPQPSRLGAIAAWNREEYSYLSYVVLAPYTTDITAWIKLRDDIILAQTADLEQAALEREIRRAAGGRYGTELRGESWFYSDGYKRLFGPRGDVVVKGIKQKAKYDYWKHQMDCRHCGINEWQCPHKADNSLWRQFLRGTAPGCPRHERDDSI